MPRRPDWLARLIAVVDQWQARPFRYGVSDCGRFGAECVEAITGKQFPMPYSSRREAVRWVQAGGGVAALITERLGEPEPGLPARGDVCLVMTEDGPGIGISMGATVAVPADAGLGFHPLSDVLKRWRV